MQETRVIENLILINQDYNFNGDLTIIGSIYVVNGSISVTGELYFKAGLFDSIIINNGSITANSLKCRAADIFVYNGNIKVNTDINACYIYCNGNIEAGNQCSVFNIFCNNFLISGDVEADDITATEDIYILGSKNYVGDLRAREIFIDGLCYFDSQKDVTVIANYFECSGQVFNCRKMIINDK